MRNFYYCQFCEQTRHYAPEEGKCAYCGRETENCEGAAQVVEDGSSSSTGSDISALMEDDSPQFSSYCSSLWAQPSKSSDSTDVIWGTVDSFDDDSLSLSEDLDADIAHGEISEIIPVHPGEKLNASNAHIWDDFRHSELRLICPWRDWAQTWSDQSMFKCYVHWLRAQVRDPIFRQALQMVSEEQALIVQHEFQIVFAGLESAVEKLCKSLYFLSRGCLRWVHVAYLQDSEGLEIVRHVDDICDSTAKSFTDYIQALEAVWNTMIEPIPGLSYLSMRSFLLLADWSGEIIPEGLGEVLPKIMPVDFYITRFKWPQCFEKWMLDHPGIAPDVPTEPGLHICPQRPRFGRQTKRYRTGSM